MMGVRLMALALLMSLMANATAFGQSTTDEPRRVALVIGNGAYASPVASAPTDARAFADMRVQSQDDGWKGKHRNRACQEHYERESDPSFKLHNPEG